MLHGAEAQRESALQLNAGTPNVACTRNHVPRQKRLGPTGSALCGYSSHQCTLGHCERHRPNGSGHLPQKHGKGSRKPAWLGSCSNCNPPNVVESRGRRVERRHRPRITHGAWQAALCGFRQIDPWNGMPALTRLIVGFHLDNHVLHLHR
jgi:hypothetical protein